MSSKKSGRDIFYRIIFFLISLIIFIGEITLKLIKFFGKMIFFPVNLIKNLALLFLKKIKKVNINLRLIKNKIKKIKWSIFRLPRFRFLQINLKLRYFVLGSLITLVIVAFYQGYFFVKNLPSPTSIGKVNFPLTTHIYDRNGQLLYEIYREQNRTPVKLNQLPAYVIQATIAAEDKDFYKHRGISLVGGVIRAFKETIIKKKLQGGSTITQQLVKSALLTPERTISRKIKEIILALWAERLYSKNQILEMYLNQVPYGGSAYGIEEAAKIYFNKSAKDLDLIEAATLAGLPQAPSLYSPHLNPQAAEMRRNTVLEAMYQEKIIDKKIYQEAIKKPLVIKPIKTTIKAPHFVFFVRQKLEESFGLQKVEEGGLRVTTTLDLRIQEEVEKILKEELEKIKDLHVTNGAVLVTRPSTGEILAMVGSIDYFSLPDGAFNVTIAERQPGSAIKPLMYSLALANGFTAATVLDDSPVVFNIEGSEPYRPVNYDNRFHGKIPLRYALANSYNVPAVRTLAVVGVENFINHARRLGITSWLDSGRYGLSLTLGGGEVKMIDMAEAYGVFANLGRKTKLTGWLKVEETLGKILAEFSPQTEMVLDPGIAFIISDILADNFARQWAFGANSNLQIPGYKVAVKTGTTNDKKDNWTIGYTPDFLVAVWVGNNDSSPMNQFLTSGITGAAPIWNRVMKYLLTNYSDGPRWFDKAENIVEKKCYFGRTEYFLKGTENKVNCQGMIMNQTPTPVYRTNQ